MAVQTKQDANSLKNKISDIFTGSADLKKFYENFGKGNEDRTIDEWQPTWDAMRVVSGNSKIILKPRIKAKQERDALREATMKLVEDNVDTIEKNISILLGPPDLYKKKAKAWEFFYDDPKPSGSSIQIYRIKVIAVLDDKPISNAETARAALTIDFQAKGLGNAEGYSSKPDPHELMTACLIKRGKKVNVNTINGKRLTKRDEAIKKLVDDLAKIASNINGAAGLDGFYMDPDKEEPDAVNLAKAISISNYVLQQIGTATVGDVYQTGTKWEGDIRQFKVGPSTIKTYNSADVIFNFQTTGKNAGQYWWGLSLKKRGITSGVPDVEPTLLNKPLMGNRGFIEKKLKDMKGGPKDIKKIEDAKLKFFREALLIKNNFRKKYNNKFISRMPIADVLKAVDKLFTERNDKSEMLRGQGSYASNPNIYFEAIDEVFIRQFNGNKDFFADFLDLIFKINLDTYLQDVAFHFSLITGTGDYQESKIMEVHPPLEKENKLSSSILRNLLGDPDNTSFVIKQQPNKKQAYQEGAGAAKLFYVMEIGKGKSAKTIVDLEVRYKGTLTAQPQFQVFMSVGQNSFSALYAKEARKKSTPKGAARWQ